MNKKLTLSHTAKDVYLECPYKYYLQYVKNIKPKQQSSALLFGICLDKALNALLEGHKDCFSVFFQAWEETSGLDIHFYKSDLDETLLKEYYDEDFLKGLSNLDLSWLSLKAKGDKLLKAYIKEIHPKLKVKHIQKTMLIDLGEFEVKGIQDLFGEFEGFTGVIDHKTTSEKYSKNSINKKDQLPLYCFFENCEHGGYITLNKKTYKCEFISGKIEKESTDRVINTFKEVYKNIKQEIFTKNEKACYSYGMKCPYYTYCKHGHLDENLYIKKKEK